MIGKQISHYTILEKLGEGGMGVVYKAEDTKLKRLVAIKFLPERLAVHGEERERFTFEAQAASALNHPAICTIFDIDEVNDETFMVMEFIEGVTLREWIQARAEKPDGYRKLGIRECVDIGAQIAEGLEKAHEKGIIHRDVKSENIMVTADLRAKIMDFGLAKLRGVSKLTKTGSTIGTVAYMSPEQIEGAETDHRTDIFSFGVVMYEMLAGQLPFRAAHETAMMYEILNVAPKELREVRPSVDEELSRIVMKCLEKNRDERYQTLREVVVDLRRYRRDSKGAPGPHPQAVRADAEQAKATPVSRYLVGAAIVLILGIAGYFLSLQFTGSASIDSVAVLPFNNAGLEQGDEYLTEGITDNITNKLSGLSHLRVVPRSLVGKYRGKEIDPREAGKDLNVSAVLTGKVTRRGEELIVQAELVDVRNISQLWGEQFNRKLSDLAAVEEEIVGKIAEKLRTEVSTEERSKLTERKTVNPAAYQLYMKGKYFWNKRTDEDARKALEFFQQAIDIEPTYAAAYAGIADCYIIANPWRLPPTELIARIRAASGKALELDENLAEAHAAYSVPKSYYEYDFTGGEKELRRALELNPNFATGHHWIGELLIFMGRFEEGIAHYNRAMELDPLSLAIASDYGKGLYYARQYDKSIELLKKAIDMDPNFVRSHFYISDSYLLKNMPDEALHEWLKGMTAAGEDQKNIDSVRIVYAREGMVGIAKYAINHAGKDSASIDYQALAIDYLTLGDKEMAVACLERLYEDRANQLVSLKVDPMLDGLRGEPKFTALLKKVGFSD